MSAATTTGQKQLMCCCVGGYIKDHPGRNWNCYLHDLGT